MGFFRFFLLGLIATANAQGKLAIIGTSRVLETKDNFKCI